MYQPLKAFDKKLFNQSEEIIHRAAQFCAMLGKNYLPDQPDDSNANLKFDPSSKKVISRSVENGLQLGLDPLKWSFELIKDGDLMDEFEITGKSKEEIFSWLKNATGSNGLDKEKLDFISHYEVPDHPIDHGDFFPSLDSNFVEDWLLMRTNAEHILYRLNQIVGVESEIRIWPHHFDTGSYYEMGEQKAIGAGWAIADTLCDNPYLYIYGWNGNQDISYEDIPTLSAGKWIIEKNWQGAVIESEDLATNEIEFSAIDDFMNSVIDFLTKQLN